MKCRKWVALWVLCAMLIAAASPPSVPASFSGCLRYLGRLVRLLP